MERTIQISLLSKDKVEKDLLSKEKVENESSPVVVAAATH